MALKPKFQLIYNWAVLDYVTTHQFTNRILNLLLNIPYVCDSRLTNHLLAKKDLYIDNKYLELEKEHLERVKSSPSWM
jgi:hypothetical protein